MRLALAFVAFIAGSVFVAFGANTWAGPSSHLHQA